MMDRKKIFELLTQNAQKGELYSLKLKTSPVAFTAIPMIRPEIKSADTEMFVFKVLQPEQHKGVYKKPVDDIEMLVKKKP